MGILKRESCVFFLTFWALFILEDVNGKFTRFRSRDLLSPCEIAPTVTIVSPIHSSRLLCRGGRGVQHADWLSRHSAVGF
jgi:hypothetical protein